MSADSSRPPFSVARRICALCTFVSAATVFAAETTNHSRTVFDVAQPRKICAGAPKPSDVCFSSRWLRPNTFDAAASFHATRLDWVYARGNRKFVADAKAKGYAFGAAVNSTLPDAAGKKAYALGRARDLNGDAIIAPWMKGWGTAWGCSNHPDYRRVWLAHAKAAIDAGADSIQMDGPSLGGSAVHWGGCFCEHCVAGFRQHLRSHTTEEERRKLGIADLDAFDYADYLRRVGTKAGESHHRWKGSAKLRVHFKKFQERSTLAFYRYVHGQLNAHAGRRVPCSCNNAARIIEYLHEVHDFGMCEWYPQHQGGPGELYHHILRPAAELGMPLLFTYVSTDVAATRRFIALTYALGSHTIVPWDVYTSSTTPRVFGTPDQYADLYGFVRANAHLLDGYEDAAVAGPELREGRHGDAPPVQICGGSGQVYAAARCRPREPEQPVVIHLVDYSDKPEPFTLVVNPRRFGSHRPIRARLLMPNPYDRSLHEQAEKSKSYASLVRTIPLTGGLRTTFEIPALSPWGIVVVEPGEVTADGVWQPRLWTSDDDCYRDALTVRMACATTDAEIRYTTDDTKPSRTSRLYTKPIRLAATTALRARAFMGDGRSSAAVRVPFTKQPGVTARPPDQGDLRQGLQLWLRADALTDKLGDGATVPRWPASVGPDLAVPTVKLLSGDMAARPTFVANAINGQPVTRFDGVDDLLAAPGFANERLAGRAFTVLMVTQSDDPCFGLSGNSLSASGGVPRLYLTRRGMTYDALVNVVRLGTPDGDAAIATFMHDGNSTAMAYLNGVVVGTRSDLPVVAEFGGGHLTVSFWSGARNHAGDLAELIVFDRRLPDAEREAIESYLAEKYGIRCRRQWK